MKSLRFKKLWLVSETERAARSISFHPKMTLMVGKNHTGKSTILKHLFRTLGCDMKGKAVKWDNLAISVLEFELDEVLYTAYRRANVFALRDESQEKIFATTNYSEWAKHIASIFDFRLMLPTHQDKIAQATPPYLFLPYYMDQDGSWLQQWNSFDKLSQFANWKKPVAAYVTGQRPNGYYVAKFKESLAKAAVNEVTQELNVIAGALSRVKRSLPKTTMRLDVSAFRNEIAELLRVATQLRNDQESLRKRTFELASQKQSLAEQVGMARDALRELEGDLKYLTEPTTDQSLVCPTCGTTHENGFSVRLSVIDDAVTMRQVIAELEDDHRRVSDALADVKLKVNRTKHKSAEIEHSLRSKKGLLKLQDVVESKSADVVLNAFDKDISELKQRLVTEEANAADLKHKASQFDDPARTKLINEFYAERIELFASELGVQDLKDDVKKKPDASISASGSALPRSLLAYQYAVLHTAKEKGDSKAFPIVIDSPNQQGQDAQHLKQMLDFIVKRTPSDQQLILAVEDMPTNFSYAGDTIELKKPFKLLEQEEYDIAYAELGNLVQAVDQAITKRMVKS
jgi:hypothetical protein